MTRRFGAARAVLSLYWLLLAVALAQPYAADGGFDRPRELVAAQQRPALALAVDRGDAVLVHIDRGRVLRQPLAARGGAAQGVTELASGNSYWEVYAAGSPDETVDAVYAWYSRDFTTGRYLYAWHTRGETRSLLDSHQVVDLRLVVGPSGPEAWITRAVPSGSRIERVRWADGEGAAPDEIVVSPLWMGGLDVAYDSVGGAHLAFLEGFTEETEFGTNADWSTRYARVDEGVASGGVDLGDAAPPVGGAVMAVDPLLVVWRNEVGEIEAVSLDAGRSATPPESVTLGAGHVVAATDNRLLWYAGGSLFARPLQPAAEVASSVAWSPLGIERAVAVRDAAGVTHLAWAGRRAGSGYALWVTDDRSPMTRNLTDRIAAGFGWSPWSQGEEAAGQLMGALLTAILVTMALVPVFWVFAAFAVGRVPHDRARLVGAAGAAALVAFGLLAVVLVSALPTEQALALAGLPWVAPIALLLGVAIGSRSLRRADLESLQALVLAACVTSLFAVSVLAFATFQHWLTLLGL